MSAPVNDVDRSAGTERIPALVDTQARAFASVLAANVRYALAEAVGAEKWMEAAVVDWYDFPVTLGLLSDYRLPSLSCWRVRTAVAGPGARRSSRRGSFAVRYWLDAAPREWLPHVWPALHAAFEVITRTLLGDGLIDLTLPDATRVPSTDILTLAGIEFVHKDTIVGASDFAVSADGEAGNVYPVLEVTFDAQHLPVFGGLPYPAEVDLPLFESMVARIWDGTAVGGREAEDQPVTTAVATATGSLLERSKALLGGE